MFFSLRERYQLFCDHDGQSSKEIKRWKRDEDRTHDFTTSAMSNNVVSNFSIRRRQKEVHRTTSRSELDEKLKN